MTSIDWVPVLVINLAIVGYGVGLARGTRTSYDWLLAARSLPWWVIGFSMFATAVDAGDYVVVAGGAYKIGMTNLTVCWLSLPIGWFLVSYFVFLPMYRGGMFTNAEYLEYRFEPISRIVSVFIQIQYRTNVLGNIAWSLYLTFAILMGWGRDTWWLVFFIAAVAALYTALGGLRAVAVTDTLQIMVMAIASFLLWFLVWNGVGGWSGLTNKLTAIDANLAKEMLYVGIGKPDVPPTLLVMVWIIIRIGYCVVNHTQSMRALGARSEWDLKMGAVVASVVTVIVMWFNITLGILGRAVFPDLDVVDEVFPLLVQKFLSPGLLGFVVAGLLAAGISTYDSIGSSLAAVFTRDVYARFIKKDGDDAHYLKVSRIVTPLIILLGFAYANPWWNAFRAAGAVVFHIKITTVFVAPLMTLYIMGTFTRVHRATGIIGLVVGMIYGLLMYFHKDLGISWPYWTGTNGWWRWVMSPLVVMLAMAISSWIITLIRGRATDEELRGLVYSPLPELGPELETVALRRIEATAGSWLETSRLEVERMPAYPFALPAEGLPWVKRPQVLTWVFIVVVGFINLVVLW